jgi:hypothetical protein
LPHSRPAWPPLWRAGTQRPPSWPPSWTSSSCGRTMETTTGAPTPSRMTRPRCCALWSAVETPTPSTALGVAGGGADPSDLDADPEDEDDGTIRRGVHELPCRRDKVGATGGGIPSRGSCRHRFARACSRGCGPARSTSGGRRRRCCAREEGRAVVGGEFVLVPLPEEVRPLLVVVGVEARLARCSSLRVTSTASISASRATRPIGGGGIGTPPRSGASLQAHGSPAARDSPPRAATFPPIGVENVGRSCCSPHRCRSPPLLG